MKIGFIGLGKLGYPCAIAIKSRGHEVMGYDVAEDRNTNEQNIPYEKDEHKSSNLKDLAQKVGGISFGATDKICEWADLILVAVQTPHEEQYDGTYLLPAERKDFDYTYLKDALNDLAKKLQKPTPVLVISTVLPSTYDKELAHIIAKNPNLLYAYNPFFIAMGTTVWDFLNPEFILLGTNDLTAGRKIIEFYETIATAPILLLTIQEAELVKVLYNTYITQKVTFTGIAAEIADKTANCDIQNVMNALKLGHRRIISASYLSPGVGDGGSCHPRDNIALSWLASQKGLSYNYFETLMQSRQAQAEWFADLLIKESELPKAIIGISYKADNPLTYGSHALLVKRILELRGYDTQVYDPVAGYYETLIRPHVCLLGTPHTEFKKLELPPNSVLLDPWHFVEKTQEDVKYIRIGARGK